MEEKEVLEENNNQQEEKHEVTSPKKSKTGLVVCIVLLAIIVIALVVLLVVPGLVKEKTSTEVKKTNTEYRMTGNNLQEFDISFLKLENQEKNKIYSPLSIKYTLAMLNEGADGATKDQITNVIGDYKSKKYMNSEHMSLANALFVRDTFKDNIIDDYTKKIKTKYDEWLAEGGCGGDPDRETYLNTYIEELNSNYKQEDYSTDFYLYDDNEVKVFAKDLKEYDGSTLQYVGIMPKEKKLTDYINELDSKKAQKLIKNLKELKSESFEEGTITQIKGNIPFFNYDYELDLMNDLQSLGIKDVFSKKANLSKMTKTNDTFILKTVHKANIEFSNEGIKAAAATAMGGGGAAGCYFVYDYEVPVKVIDMTFDKPYMYIIRDKASGEVWFAGTVYEPSTK